MQTILSTLLSGLRDYTIDERGDVGSWIRIACVQGLTSCIEDLFSVAESVSDFADYLPVSSYQQAIAGILKQGVERLDNVRQEASTPGQCSTRGWNVYLAFVEADACTTRGTHLVFT